MMSSRGLSRRLMIIAALLSFLSGAFCVQKAQAQAKAAYSEIPVNGSVKDDARGRPSQNLSTVRNNVMTILRGEKSLGDPTSRKDLDLFFRGYMFPRMTHVNRTEQFAKDRRDLIRKYIRYASNDRVHDYIVKDLTLGYMKNIIEHPRYNFHPAAKVNAMLVIGQLNEDEMVSQGDQKKPPVALRDALALMYLQLKDPKQIDAVKVAALVGILRHAELDGQRTPNDSQKIDTRARQAVIDLMLQIVNQTDPPKNRAPQGHQWIRRRAIDVLGSFGDPGASGQVVTTLTNLVQDDKQPLSVRCTSAVALGRIRYGQELRVDPNLVSRNLTQLAAYAFRLEANRLEEEKKQAEERKKLMTALGAGGGLAGGMQGGMMGGMQGGMMGGMQGGMEEMQGEMMGGMQGGMQGGMMGGMQGGMQGGMMGGMQGGMQGGMMGGMQGGMMGGMMGGAGGKQGEDEANKPSDPVDERRVSLARRRVKYELQCVTFGLLGWRESDKLGIDLVAQQEPQKQYIKAITTALQEVAKTADNKELTTETFVEGLRKSVSELEKLANAGPNLGKPAAKKQPAAPGPPPFGAAKAPSG